MSSLGQRLDELLSHAQFVLAAIALVVAPWLFGAWEMWWFWTFAVCVFASAFLFAVRMGVRVVGEDRGSRRMREGQRDTWDALLLTLCLAGFAVFLVYAFVRMLQAPVFMDAQRSFLLFLTSFFLGIQIVFGFGNTQLRRLFQLLAADLFLLGVYGIVNHAWTGSEFVMWEKAYPQYFRDGRASGSYFCPDHFSGIMELMFCMGLGLLLARESRRASRVWAAAMLAVALAGVILSKSRGGGLTVLVVCLAALLWGFLQWRPAVRWRWRFGALLLLLLSLTVFSRFETAYKRRFLSYFGWRPGREMSLAEMKPVVTQRLLASSRGRMIPAALRAWQTSPLLGIGPGMHQNLWFHFAASPDGDRETGRWPTFSNYTFHSYEVHSDWVQLLEEYGLVGLALLLVPGSMVFSLLLTGLYRHERARRGAGWQTPGTENYACFTTGILVCVCMAFHSLGDFNLQMPATAWVFTALVTLPLPYVAGVGPLRRKRRHSRRRKTS